MLYYLTEIFLNVINISVFKFKKNYYSKILFCKIFGNRTAHFSPEQSLGLDVDNVRVGCSNEM